MHCILNGLDILRIGRCNNQHQDCWKSKWEKLNNCDKDLLCSKRRFQSELFIYRSTESPNLEITIFRCSNAVIERAHCKRQPVYRHILICVVDIKPPHPHIHSLLHVQLNWSSKILGLEIKIVLPGSVSRKFRSDARLWPSKPRKTSIGGYRDGFRPQTRIFSQRSDCRRATPEIATSCAN